MLWKLLRGLVVLLGGGAGFAYYHYVGCLSGGCPIASNPWLATGYGMAIGGFVAWSLRSAAPQQPRAGADAGQS